MACACKTNQQILYLQQQYGVHKNAIHTSTNRGFNLAGKLKDAIVYTVAACASPFIFLYVFSTGLFGKKRIKLNTSKNGIKFKL